MERPEKGGKSSLSVFTRRSPFPPLGGRVFLVFCGADKEKQMSLSVKARANIIRRGY